MSIRTRLNILFFTFLITSLALGLISLIAVRQYARGLRMMTTFNQRAQRVEDLLALVYKQQQIEADVRPESYELESEALGEQVFERMSVLAADVEEREFINRVEDRYAAWYVAASPDALRDLVAEQQELLAEPRRRTTLERSGAVWTALFARLDRLGRLASADRAREAVRAVEAQSKKWRQVADAQAALSPQEAERSQAAVAALHAAIDELGAAVAAGRLGPEDTAETALQAARRAALVRLEAAIDALRNSYLNKSERVVGDWGMAGFYAELTVAMAFLLILSEVMVGSFIVHRWVIRPLTAMSQAASRIGSGDLDYRVGITGRDEVAHLAEQFDDMAAKLKQHQSRLLEAKELATLGAISSSVAHGMRNPLAGIRASAQLLATRVSGDREMSEQIREIIEEVDRLSSRISRLVYLAKQSHLELASVPASELLSAAADEARSHLQSRSIKLEINDETNGAIIQADADKMAQTLAELLSNAAHHCSHGSVVTFTCSFEPERAAVCYTVADRGPGIEPHVLEQVFDLFYSTRPQGTGMGLACAKRIVEMHGGSIALESEVGVGTTVRLRLPVVAIPS